MLLRMAVDHDWLETRIQEKGNLGRKTTMFGLVKGAKIYIFILTLLNIRGKKAEVFSS